MITLYCMPDEFAPGYEGRLARVGLDTSIGKLRTRLIARFSLPSDTPRAELLAHAARMATTEFIQLHTLLPLRQFVVRPPQSVKDQRATERTTSIRQLAMQSASSSAKFCRHCVEEDLSFHGFSYWRRSHHLTGVDWCLKHLTPLAELKGDAEGFSSFSNMPSEHMDSECCASSTMLELSASPALTQLLEIALGTLELGEPVTCVQMAQVLKGRVRAADLRMSRQGTRRLLSDLAREQLPAPWLSRHLPGLASSAPGQYCPVIDDVTRARNVPQPHLSYLVALTMICESAEDALHLIESARRIDPAPVSNLARRTYSRSFWQSTELRSLYVACGGSHNRVAKQLGLSNIHVRNELARAGLPAVESMPHEIARALHKYLNGVPLPSVVNQDANLSDQLDYWLRQDLWTIRNLLDQRLTGLTTS